MVKWLKNVDISTELKLAAGILRRKENGNKRSKNS
nr:MAG TPA: hypothetical protein [Caudoviricetes sp.]